jgi:hypothetical protein
MEPLPNTESDFIDGDGQQPIYVNQSIDAPSFRNLDQILGSIDTGLSDVDSSDSILNLTLEEDSAVQQSCRRYSLSSSSTGDNIKGNSEDDDESIFQCHSIENDDMPLWERSLFRLSTTASAGRQNSNHRMTTAQTVVHYPPPPRKMILAHTESRDCAYDVGDNEIDDFSFDTNHSDFFIQSLPSKQRLSFNQRQNSQIYRHNVNREMVLNPGTTNSGNSYDEQHYSTIRQQNYYHQHSLSGIPASLSRGRALNSMVMRATTTGTATTVSSTNTNTSQNCQYFIRSCHSSNLIQLKDSESTLDLQSSSFTSYAPLSMAAAFDGGLGICDDIFSPEDDDDDEWDSHSDSSCVVVVDNSDEDDDDDGIGPRTLCWDFPHYEMTAGCNTHE